MRPAFKITFNQTNITSLVADRLISLTVEDSAGVKSDRCELVLDDRDQRLDIPSTKTKLSVEIGYTDKLVKKGDYIIEEVEIEGPERRMRIRANATGASKGSGAAKSKSWDDITLGGIARAIASKHGWSPAISAELDNIKYTHVDQTQSDLEFITLLASDNGGVAKIAHNKLVIAPHSFGNTVTGKKLPRIAIDASQVTEWSMTFKERGNFSGCKAEYHDLDTGERGEELEGEDDENTTRLPFSYPTRDAAKRAAKSRHHSYKRGKAPLTISSMPGNPLIEAETVVVATGFRRGVDGEWTVNSVRHRITDSGYTCSLECEIPNSSNRKATGVNEWTK